jgi:hypothetical protein
MEVVKSKLPYRVEHVTGNNKLLKNDAGQGLEY